MAYENSIEGKTVSQKSSEQEYVLLADWLQIYVADKNKWNRLWTVLKQQCLMFYVTDSEEDDNWFGTIMLKSIQVEEKILGTEPHCFTLMYQQGEADWSTQNEDITEVLQKGSSLDVMAPSEIAKKCWIDSLSALLPTIPTDNKTEASVESTEQQGQAEDGESTYSSVKPEATETEETAYIEREHAGQVKSDVDIASALWSVLSQLFFLHSF